MINRISIFGVLVRPSFVMASSEIPSVAVYTFVPSYPTMVIICAGSSTTWIVIEIEMRQAHNLYDDWTRIMPSKKLFLHYQAAVENDSMNACFRQDDNIKVSSA